MRAKQCQQLQVQFILDILSKFDLQVQATDTQLSEYTKCAIYFSLSAFVCYGKRTKEETYLLIYQ